MNDGGDKFKSKSKSLKTKDHPFLIIKESVRPR